MDQIEKLIATLLENDALIMSALTDVVRSGAMVAKLEFRAKQSTELAALIRTPWRG